MTKPKLLDLFCGAGGASVGYHRAGFEVVGVDINKQPNYPFTFYRADAISFDLAGFDVIHASPPCQRYSVATKRHAGRSGLHPDLLQPIIDRLVGNGVPWVVENVPGAPMTADVVLCGSMFGLGVRRHRLFASSNHLTAPPCRHDLQLPKYNIYQHGKWYLSPVSHVYGNGGGKGDWKEAMDIDWMTLKEIAQSIPPAYTEYIGRQMFAT